MNRAGYSDLCDDNWSLIRWRGAVNQAIRGARGQKFLRDLVDALEKMPERKLIAKKLNADGAFCALGVGCVLRGVDPADYEFPDDPDFDFDKMDTERLAEALNIAPALAREIMFINDDPFAYMPTKDLDERRWFAVRDWALRHITPKDDAAEG